VAFSEYMNFTVLVQKKGANTQTMHPLF